MKLNTISLSGTHCTGKTTLLKKMAEDDFFKDYTFFDSPTRQAKETGLEINNVADNYDKTQIFCQNYDVQKIIDTSIHGKYIFDRSLLDTYIYTKYLHHKGKVSDKAMRVVTSNWDGLKHNYSLFIIPDKEDVPFEKDGVRVDDDGFREDIHRILLEVLQVEPLRSLFVKGDTEKRIEQIKNFIQKYGQQD